MWGYLPKISKSSKKEKFKGSGLEAPIIITMHCAFHNVLARSFADCGHFMIETGSNNKALQRRSALISMKSIVKQECKICICKGRTCRRRRKISCGRSFVSSSLANWQSSNRILDYVRSQVSAGGPGPAPGSLLDSLLVQLLRTVLPAVVYHTGLVHLHLGACPAIGAVTHTTPSHRTSQA